MPLKKSFEFVSINKFKRKKMLTSWHFKTLFMEQTLNKQANKPQFFLIKVSIYPKPCRA